MHTLVSRGASMLKGKIQGGEAMLAIFVTEDGTSVATIGDEFSLFNGLVSVGSTDKGIAEAIKRSATALDEIEQCDCDKCTLRRAVFREDYDTARELMAKIERTKKGKIVAVPMGGPSSNIIN